MGALLSLPIFDGGRREAGVQGAQAQLEGIQYDLQQPFMTKWNVNVQRELFAKTLLEIGYSGSHGEKLVRQIYTNGRIAQVTADGRLYVAAPNCMLLTAV